MCWPFTVWINCSNDLKTFTNSRPSASNFKSFSRSLEQIFLTVCQNNFGNKIPYPIVPCLIYHPLLQRSESRFLSFNAWLVDGKIQIESNLPLVTYSADSPHSYRIHSMVQRRFPMKFKTFYKINSSHSEIYLFVWMLKSPLHTTVFEIKMWQCQNFIR